MKEDVSSSWVSTLRRIAAPAAAGIGTGPAGAVDETEAAERCDFCGRPIPPEHRHFADLTLMKFMCACELCAVRQAERGVFKPLPQRRLRLDAFNLPEALWHELAIPVAMAFFSFSSARQRVVAFYPAPTGATESELRLEAWEKLKQLNPILKDLAADLEALLINRTEGARDAFLVPIDVCYRLVGLMRTSWQSLAGGPEALDAIQEFFAELKEESSPCRT